MTDLVQVSFDKIMQTSSYTVVVLGSEGKRFAIYTEPSVGKTIQAYFTGEKKYRPSTFELINRMLKAMEVRIKQIVIKDIEDTIYFARLFLEQDIGDQKHIMEIDARPSDCITLALMHNAPVYCVKDVLDKTVPVEDMDD